MFHFGRNTHTEMRPELARIAVPAPTLSAYDALVEGAR